MINKEIQKEIYDLCIDKKDILREYELTINKKIEVIENDELIEIVEDLVTEKNTLIVCFDNSEKVLDIIKKSEIPHILLPEYCYEEWENVLPMIIQGKFQ